MQYFMRYCGGGGRNCYYMVYLHMKTFNWLEDGKEQTDNIYFITFIKNL